MKSCKFYRSEKILQSDWTQTDWRSSALLIELGGLICQLQFKIRIHILAVSLTKIYVKHNLRRLYYYVENVLSKYI